MTPLYTKVEEQRVRLQRRVRDWTRSGLVPPETLAAIDADLRVNLRRTGPILRVVLALFTAMCVVGGIGFALLLFDLDDEVPVGLALAVCAVACARGAELLVTGYRLYRHGVEETLALVSVGAAAAAAGLLVSAVTPGGDPPAIAALAVGAVVSWRTFQRFGFVYAALLAVACVAALPFQLHLGAPTERLAACVLVGAVWLYAGSVYGRLGDEYPGDVAGTVQASSAIGVYLLVNLYLSGEVGVVYGSRQVSGWFVWTTWVLIWVLPWIVLGQAFRARHPWLLRAGLAMAIATLISNKPYLGWERQAWDPMLLGALLAGVAVAVRRWLATGPDAQRGGFTADRLLASDLEVVRLAGLASVGVQPDRPAPSDPSPFHGGRSGGGGASADF